MVARRPDGQQTTTITGGHMLQVFRTHDGPKYPIIPLFLHTILGPEYSVPSPVTVIVIDQQLQSINSAYPRTLAYPIPGIYSHVKCKVFSFV